MRTLFRNMNALHDSFHEQQAQQSHFLFQSTNRYATAPEESKQKNKTRLYLTCGGRKETHYEEHYCWCTVNGHGTTVETGSLGEDCKSLKAESANDQREEDGLKDPNHANKPNCVTHVRGALVSNFTEGNLQSLDDYDDTANEDVDSDEELVQQPIEFNQQDFDLGDENDDGTEDVGNGLLTSQFNQG